MLHSEHIQYVVRIYMRAHTETSKFMNMHEQLTQSYLKVLVAGLLTFKHIITFNLAVIVKDIVIGPYIAKCDTSV